MAQPVNRTPLLPRPGGRSIEQLAAYDAALNTALYDTLMKIAQRLNLAIPLDGSEALQAPLPLKSYTVAGLPTASAWLGSIIYVSNGTGNKRLAVSDGTNWRFPDGNVVS